MLKSLSSIKRPFSCFSRQASQSAFNEAAKLASEVSTVDCKDSIEFLLNGKKVVLKQGEFNPTQPLIEWLRSDKINLKGTKLSCGEGGCGSCTVLLTQYDISKNKYVHRPINSCLMPLGMAHGQSITTIEHLGSVEKGLHPIQKAFIKHHAVQCGYCTPGFVLNAYSMTLDNPSPTIQDIQNRFDGNICRCTGYRAIHDALKEFTKDGKLNEGAKEISDDSQCKTYICPDPEHFPRNVELKPAKIEYKGTTFYVPTDLSQLLFLKKKHPNGVLVAGSTELGIDIKVKNQLAPVYISLHKVQELNHVDVVNDSQLYIGASTCLQDILDFSRDSKRVPQEQSRFFKQLEERLQTFSSTQIRNVACAVGNIACGSPVTDLSNFLIANNAVLTVIDATTFKTRELSMNDFYTGFRKTSLNPSDVVCSITVPLLEQDEHMFVFKQSHRRDDDICICSATMRANIDEKTNIIKNINIAYSNLSPFPKHAELAEKFLKGKEFTLENIREAYSYLQSDFPLDEQTPGGHVEFRRQLTTSFLFRFFNQVEKERGRPYDKSATEIIERPLTKAGIKTHMHENGCECKRTHDTMMNVAKPIHQASAEEISTGEALYTPDILLPARGLCAGVVMSTVPHGKIKKVDYSKCLQVPGVVDVVTYKDVKGINLVGDVINDEPVFAEDEVQYVGQAIALVLAEDNETAWKAAKLAEIEYEELPSVLSIEEAIEKNSYFDFHHKIKRGDPEEALKHCKHVIEGQFEIGGQEHFYLETQNCLAEPIEGNKIKVTSSTQAPTTNQVQIARSCGLKMSDIVVEVNRLGGAFGGKETQGTIPSNMASVAALKVKRPVKIIFNRQDDFQFTGKRHPFLMKYKAGFDDNGKLEACISHLYAGCGWSVDISIAVTDRALFHTDGAYYCPNFYTECHMCKTNLPSSTAFRGFGGPQGSFMADEIMDRIAYVLGKKPEEIRKINLYKEGDKTHFGSSLDENQLDACWKYIDKTFDIKKQRKIAEEFNRNNRYKKLGVGVTPLKFGISFTFGALNQAGALVNIYKDGSVRISHSGTEMGQGLNIKLLQIVSSTLRVPLESISMSPTSTAVIPNTSPTAASSGTDLNGWALYNACVELNKRLDKYRTPDRTFQQAVMAAYFDKVDLSARGFYGTPGITWNWDTGKGHPFAYYTYGVGASLVEIDTLTGDHFVKRCDIVYDVGRSINPAVDMGQIEGGFIQGYGYLTMEELVHGDNKDVKWFKPGKYQTNGPGYYKVPGFNDIPEEFNVSILPGSVNKQGIYSSKAIGEPPLILANAIGVALKDAIMASRRENGAEPYFELQYPLTADRIKVLSAAKI